MLKVQDVYKSYPKSGTLFKKERLEVLSGINFEIKQGECIGLIGESGSGKSTLSRLIMDLEKPDRGIITIDGEDIRNWKKRNMGEMSVVFQDYTSSVNPKFTVEEIISEAISIQGKTNDMKERVIQLLDRVALSEKFLKKYSHELSGGQLQRVCIARAIATNPRFIILDEAISSLDVPVQSQILDLLKELKNEFNLTYLFIAHDLQAVASLCDHVLFLYKGKIEEMIVVSQLAYTKNPYAKKLLNSVITLN